MELLDEIKAKKNKKLMDANYVLIMGILSVIFVGILGVILAIANIMKSNEVLRLYDNNPNLYAERYFKRAKAGKIISITGLIVRVVALVILVNVFG